MAQGVLESFAQAHVDGIVTACGSCAWTLAKTWPELSQGRTAHDLAGRVREISQVLAEHPGRFLAVGPGGQGVAVHDPCHLKIGLKVHQEPRAMLQAAGVESAPLTQPDACCGGGGLFALNQPELSQAIFAPRAKDLSASGASVLATSCSGCWLQWKANLAPGFRVVHPIELLLPA
jgi:glycolate oxidase iron-sulfur subunit